MLSWLAKRMVSRNMARLRDGDYKPLLRLDARDIRFRFPGDSSWATELQGKRAHGEWLARFAEVGLQIFPDEVVLKGPPWRATMCVRGNVHLDDAAGKRVYENRYVLWGMLRWGFLKNYEVYEDTQLSLALDQYLAAHSAS
jgi:ketosteroid isomerase-like protein